MVTPFRGSKLIGISNNLCVYLLFGVISKTLHQAPLTTFVKNYIPRDNALCNSKVILNQNSPLDGNMEYWWGRVKYDIARFNPVIWNLQCTIMTHTYGELTHKPPSCLQMEIWSTNGEGWNIQSVHLPPSPSFPEKGQSFFLSINALTSYRMLLNWERDSCN